MKKAILPLIFLTSLLASCGSTNLGAAQIDSNSAILTQGTLDAQAVKNCNAKDNENLGLTVLQFVGKCVKGSVLSEIPTYLQSKTVKYIIDNQRKGNQDIQKTYKLITDGRFRK